MVRKLVELMLVLVLSAAVSAHARDRASFVAHVIDDNAGGAASLHACDLDGDGDMDLVGALLEDSAVVWWRNDGRQATAWTRFVVDGRFRAAISVYTGDLDGDGEDDVAGAAVMGDEIAWWRNEGGNPGGWKKYSIRTGYDFAHEVYLHDVDILGAAYLGGEIAWWENDGNFLKQTIGSDFPRACIAAWADMDDDGDLDVVGSSQEGNEVAMWWNDGGSPVHWVKLHVDSLVRVWPLCLADLDADGDTDIVAGSGFRGVNRVMWWENR